jgi:hypothetical protein
MGRTFTTLFASSTDSAAGGVAATDGTNVYYVVGSQLMKIPVTGGTPVVWVPTSYDVQSYYLAIDDTSVYLSGAFGADILKVSKC